MERGVSAASTLFIVVEQMARRAVICVICRFSASITICSSGGNSIADIEAVPLEAGIANFLADVSACSVVFSRTTSFPFLEVLASGASSMAILTSGLIFADLTGSDSVISLSGRFGDFPSTKASLASMLESFCGALERTLALSNIALWSFFRTGGMVKMPATRSQFIEGMRRARE